MKCWVGFALFWCVVCSALAVIESYEFSDPALESRYHRLSQELRCPKCQNQNIADSNAPISRDLRSLLHQQLEAGASDEEILQFMVDRYGEFVRYRPAVDQNTVVLWYAPVVLTVVGFLGLGIHLRRRRGGDQSGPSDEELLALRARMRTSDSRSTSSEQSP